MSLFDGNGREMPEHRPVDDGAIEASLGGTVRGEAIDPLSSFVSGVRSAIGAAPAPSTAMAAVLTAGFSTEKGDLSATAASNVNGPASQEAGLSKWRKAKMKIQGFLAGLGVAGKIALGVGVAAAATTTGAGATGMLPFSVPGLGHSHHHRVLVVATTTTTQARVSGATCQRRHTSRKIVSASSDTYSRAGTVTSTTTSSTTPTLSVTPPTSETTPPTSTTTATTVPEPTTLATTTTQPPETTTTTQPPGPSIELSCAVTGPTQVTCAWSSAPATVAKYALWRWTTNGNGSDYAPIYESANGFGFVDNDVTPGVAYTYRVFTTLGDGTQGPVSNKAYVT
jgi:hypothetical protein